MLERGIFEDSLVVSSSFTAAVSMESQLPECARTNTLATVNSCRQSGAPKDLVLILHYSLEDLFLLANLKM